MPTIEEMKKRMEKGGPLPQRIRELLEEHPDEVFAASDVVKALKTDDREKVVQTLGRLHRNGEIGKYGERATAVYGNKEAVEEYINAK